MPTASMLAAHQAVAEGEVAHVVHGLDRSALVVNARASLGVANIRVVSSCASNPARSVPEAWAMAVAGGLAPRRRALHQRHRLVPGADQRLAEGRVVLQRLGVDHHQVDDLAGDLARS